MANEAVFSPLDPIADLQATITFEEARQALALCMQFFLVSSAVEFEQLHHTIDTLVEPDAYLRATAFADSASPAMQISSLLIGVVRMYK